MSEIKSNSIKILNISDGQSGFVHKGEAASVEELIKTYGEPQSGWMYYNTTDNTSYIYDNGQWNKVASDGSAADEGKLDIRYSNDGKEFTKNEDTGSLGTVVGPFIGYRIVEKDFDENSLTEEDFNKYEWSEIKNDVVFNIKFLIDVDGTSAEISKFYRKDQTSDYYEYSPNEFRLSFKKEQNNIATSLNENYYYQAILIFSNGEKLYPIEIKKIVENIETNQLDCNNDNFIDLTKYSSQKNELNQLIHLQEIQVSLFQKISEGFSNLLAAKSFYATFGMKEDMAKFSLNASNITAAIDSTKLVFNEQGASVYNGGLRIFKNNNDEAPVFFADENGDLTLQGSIITQKGTIGGWTIASGELYSGDTGLRSDNEIQYENSPVRFYAGKDLEMNDFFAHFIVTTNGNLYATNANITGSIHATNGDIQDYFYIGPKPTQSSNGIIIYGGLQNEQSFIGSSKFSSGSFGTGWKISSDGTAEFTNINARGRISSSVFEYSKISSIGGSMYIAPTLFLNESSTSIELDGDNYFITWNYPNADLTNGSVCGRTWKVGDEVRLEGIAVIDETQTVELNNIIAFIKKLDKDVNGSILTLSISKNVFEKELSITAQIADGAIVIFYSSMNESNQPVHQGIYLTAADANAPYIDIYDSQYTQDNQVTYPSVRLGNLSGITNDLFSMGPLKGFGLYSTNAYLTGELILPNSGITNQNSIAYNGEKYDDITSSENKDKSIRIWAGAVRPSENSNEIAPFIVTQDGSLYAKKGVFEGEINATSGTFSGVIKAAGIVIDNPKTEDIIEAPINHFFVAYTDNPVTYDDYVLNINSSGLSIWEGGLQAYSDAASKTWNNNYTNEVYGYDSTYLEPLPYFYLVDASSPDGTILHNRTVSYKNHIFSLNEDSGWSSLLIDNGLWLSKGKKEKIENKTLNSKKAIENEAYNSHNEKNNGIYTTGNDLCFVSPNEYIFNAGARLKVNTTMDMIGVVEKATINLGNIKIQEISVGTNNIGINFI